MIRFSSQDGLAGKVNKLVRPRTLIYPLILAVVVGGLAFAVNEKSGFDSRVIRGKGSPFTIVAGGQVSNSISLRLVNRTDVDQLYSIQIVSPESVKLEVIDKDALLLTSGESVLVPMEIRFPSGLTSGNGQSSIEMRVADQNGNERTVNFRVLGPR